MTATADTASRRKRYLALAVVAGLGLPRAAFAFALRRCRALQRAG